MLCLSRHLGWTTSQVDFSNAFVQASLNEDIYIRVPATYQARKGPGHVLKLKKSLYGLVQAPMYWYRHLRAALEDEGLTPSEFDPCMFYGQNLEVLCYVDDCLLLAKDQRDTAAFIHNLKSKGYSLTE